MALVLLNILYTARWYLLTLHILADIKGVKSFWLIAFKNVDLLASMIQENDEPILEHLTNVKVQFSAEPMVSLCCLQTAFSIFLKV